MQVIFSFSLFPGQFIDHYPYYRDSTLVFIRSMREQFPGAAFVAHVLDSVPEADCRALVAAASGKCTVKRYAFSKKRGAYWLVGAMRFRTLWEHEGPETVIVADVHDDVRIMTKQVRARAFDWRGPLPLPLPARPISAEIMIFLTHCHTADPETGRGGGSREGRGGHHILGGQVRPPPSTLSLCVRALRVFVEVVSCGRARA